MLRRSHPGPLAVAGVALGASAAFAVSAPADSPATRPPAPVTQVLLDRGPIAAGIDEALRRARRRAAEARRGVHPVAGRVDYGTAINAFGVARGGHTHGGQDVFAPTGTPLRAIHDGRVVETGTDGGRGNYVVLYSPSVRRSFAYFHMVEPASVRRGQHVRAGQRVGAVGCTGHCQGAHLHLEMRAGRGADGRAIDPLPLLRKLR